MHETLRRFRHQAAGSGSLDVTSYAERFSEAMNDDFNTPIAIAVLFDLSKAINSALDSKGIVEADRAAIEAFLTMAATNTLGIASNNLADEQANGNSMQRLDKVMQIMLELRHNALQQKDFATSDKIRDMLLAAGIEIKDTKEGAVWSVKG